MGNQVQHDFGFIGQADFGPLVNKLACLLQQHHRRAQTRGIDLRALGRGGRGAVQADIPVAEIRKIPYIGQLPLLFVAFFLAFDHRVGGLAFERREFDR